VGAQRTALASLRRNLEVDEWGKLRAAYVVPSGRIHFVPWGALDMPYPVAVLPNGGWVSRSARGASEGARAVVLGDPVFGGALPQLSGARAEAASVSKTYASAPLIGAAATEQALRTQAGTGTDVLHLATHALYDPVFPLQSSLILTDGKRAVPLTAEALFQRPISARLVVLSACETGMGKVISGDDLLGLARSFYLGGASAIVSSLWPVDDEATQIFMEVFHERARRGSYGSAWLAARDAVRDKGYNPSSYGAFVLGGSLGFMP
jgi:CHAT domain-containing protein